MNNLKYLMFSIVLVLLSCKNEDKNKVASLNDIIPIRGTWKFTTINSMVCNDCPKIIFSKKGLGSFIMSPKEEKQFKYKVNKNKLTIFDASFKNFFSETKNFFYKIEIEDSSSELTLTAVNGKGKYILSEEID